MNGKINEGMFEWIKNWMNKWMNEYHQKADK